MKRITFYQVLFVIVMLQIFPFVGKSQSFTSGNIVLLRVGDGTAALSSTSAAVFLDEYTPTGTFVQTVAIPTTGTNRLVNSGSATSEGLITLSPDKYYLTLAGYDATNGVATIAASTAAVNPRKLLRIDNAINYTAVTSSTAYSANNIRSGITFNNNYWASGTATGTIGGVQYFGTGTACQVSSTVTNVRSLNIFNGQLYFSTGSGTLGLYSVGTGLPTTTGTTSTSFIPTGTGSSPYGFSINSTGDICYISDDRTTVAGGILKYTKSGSTWTLAYTLSVGTSVGSRGITVDWSGASPVLYATTTASKLVKITDAGTGSPYTELVAAPTNTAFRGVAFAPIPQASTSPIVLTGSPSAITATTATCSGNVVSDGGSSVILRGICYGTSSNPDTATAKLLISGTTGSFSANLNSLTGNTIYHYRAFAQNAIGLSYGPDSVFTTAAAAVAPVLSSDSITSITTTSALVYGNVLNDGGATVTARGICWNTSLNPTISDNHSTESGTIGYFYSALSNLTSSTTYHVRAYATNSVGTAYGSDLTFTTITILPTYTIGQIRTVNATTGVPDSANVNCRIQGIVHGLNYGTAGLSFYIMDATSGINVFRASGNLGYTVTEGDLINVMGKITNYFGLIEISADSIVDISAGNTLNIPYLVSSLDESTESRLVKMDSLIYVSGWPTTSANANVNVIRGSQAFILRVYGASNLYTASAPTSMFSAIGIGNQYVAASPYLGGYQLSPRYLADIISTPSDSTLSHANVTTTTADCYGKVSYDWGSTITARGICYSTNVNPTILDNHVNVTGTTGNFTATLTGLSPNTLYHYRAYATNSNGTSYGNDSTFSTIVSVLPTKLSIVTINNNKAISANTPFDIYIQAQDAAGTAKNVTSDTKIILTSNGTLGGLNYGYIYTGTNGTTIHGVTLTSGSNITISAIDSASVLSTATSSTFNVLEAAIKLTFNNLPSAAFSFQTLTFNVQALRSDNSIDSNFIGNIMLNKISGTGNLLGTTTKTAVSGISTFNDISFDQADTYQLNAVSTGLSATPYSSIIITPGPQMVELVVPKFIGCKNSSTNTERTPIAICIQFKNLEPDTIYDIKAQIGLLSDDANTFGAGNLWNGSAFSGSNLNHAFTTDANGNSQPVWIYLTSTGNASRFDAGQVHNLRVGYAKSGYSISSKPSFIGTKTITALDIAKTARTAATTDDGAFLRGTADTTASGKYILIFDNIDGLGDPLCSYQIRQSIATQGTQTDLPRQIDSVYMQAGTTKKGDYALIVPIGLNNPNGIRRIEARNADNTLYAFNIASSGIWANGANTTAINRRDTIRIALTDAPLIPITAKKLNITAMLQNLYDQNTQTMFKTQDIDWNDGSIFDKFPGTVVDTVSLLIRSVNTPDFAIEFAYNGLEINQNGTITELSLPLNFDGNHYLVVLHRNSVETWSEPVNFSSSVISYNFFTAPLSINFENNMYNLGNRNLIWGGDINIDGVVNIFDLSSVFDAINDPTGMLGAGYSVNDLNGDGVVNIYDLSITFDTMNLGAGSINPFTIK